MVWLLAFVWQTAFGAPLFEAYNKLLSGGVPTGYIITRFESDAKGNLTSYGYTRTNAMGGEIMESIKSVCDKKFAPISFSYTSKIGNDITLIDGKVKGQKLDVTITKNGKTEKKSTQIEKGTFLSQFLVYLMLTNPKGLAKSLKYTYKAIAEESGDVHSGESFVDSQEVFKGFSVYKVLNTYKDAKFISFVTNNGEILLTKSPLQGVSVEMVADREEATKNLPFDGKSIALLFGEIPQGKLNVLNKLAEKRLADANKLDPKEKTDTPPKEDAAKRDTSSAKSSQNNDKLNSAPVESQSPAAPTELPAKGADVPSGQGIHTKSSGG